MEPGQFAPGGGGHIDRNEVPGTIRRIPDAIEIDDPALARRHRQGNSVQHGGGDAALPVANQGGYFLFFSAINPGGSLGSLHAHDGGGRMDLDPRGPAEGFTDVGADLPAPLAEDRRHGERLGANHQVLQKQFGVRAQAESRVVHEHQLEGSAGPGAQRIAVEYIIIDGGRGPGDLAGAQQVCPARDARHETDGLRRVARTRCRQPEHQGQQQNPCTPAEGAHGGAASNVHGRDRSRNASFHWGPLAKQKPRSRRGPRRQNAPIGSNTGKCP